MDMKKDTLSDFNRENNSNLAYTGAGDGNEPWNLPENPFDKTYDSGFLTEDKLESTENNTWRRHGYAIVKKIGFNELVNDVINDFNRRYETEFTYKLVGDALVERLHLISTFEPIMCSDAYAFCFYCLYSLCCEIEGGLVTDAEAFGASILFGPSEEYLKNKAVMMQFGWRPEALLRIYDLGHEILEVAKTAWLDGNKWHAEDSVLKYVNKLYNQMQAAKEELESLEYVYTSKDMIMELYNGVVVDAKKDIDTINGDMVHISEALKHVICKDLDLYIEALYRQASEDYPGFKIG